MQSRERNGRAEAQSSNEARSRATCNEFCFIRFFDGAPGALVEILSSLGRRQPA